MRVYGYLRASTNDQDAERAKDALIAFAQEHNIIVSTWFVENVSGATLKRPELFRLLDVAQGGDVLLVEQVDRISRLNSKDWKSLKTAIMEKGIRVVSLDLPMSHTIMNNSDSFTDRMLDAINSMMLDMLAAVARKDYEDRRKRQKQGVLKAKEAGKYKGRPINVKLHNAVKKLLVAGNTYTEIIDTLGCSRGTISKISKAMT